MHQPGFQDLKGLGQGALPQGLQVIHHQLVFAPGFVNRQASPAEELAALLGLEAQVLVTALEEHRPELGAGVLEGEVVVAAQGLPEVGDLAAHPDQGEIGLQAVPNLPGEGAHRIDVGQFLIHKNYYKIISYSPGRRRKYFTGGDLRDTGAGVNAGCVLCIIMRRVRAPNWLSN